MALEAGTRLGPYQVVALLGRGGMGEVYRATDTRISRTVALKILPPEVAHRAERRQRFEREAHAIARLNHPHICALYDVGQRGDIAFLVMEYLEGETLAARLRRGPLPPAEALAHATALAEAVARAHHEGIVHRDIKPGNVMLTASGVKLLDFGLAKLRDLDDQPSPSSAEASTAESASHAGHIVGTFAYMAPEQLEGRACDARTDVFALGVVLYEMFAGRHPFGKSGQADVVAAILGDTPVPLKEVYLAATPELDRAIGLCLARRPDDRWQSAADLARELAWLGGGSRASTTMGMPVRRWVRSVEVVAAAAVIAAAIGVAGIGWRRQAAMSVRSLAVLPCRTIGSDMRGQTYCDGLAETLTAKLTPLTLANALQMTPASEVRKRGVLSASDARKAFGATLTLEGSVSSEGSAIRVNYALVDTATLRQIDAYSTTAVSDPFSVQDQVVEWAVRALALTPSASERATLTAHGTAVPSAHDFYLQGIGYLLDPQKLSNVDSAIELFERTVALDPKYALAYAGLGRAQWLRYESTREPFWVQKARESCGKAVEIAPNAPEARLCVGTLEQGTGNYHRAVETFTKVLADDPTSDEAYIGLANAYQSLGDDAKAEETFRRAVAQRPQYWPAHDWLGSFYRDRARYEAAAEQFAAVVALTPTNPTGYISLGAQHVFMGRYDDALAAFRRSVQLHPTPFGYANLGMVLYRQRRFDEAGDALRQALAFRSGDFRILSNLARVYFWGGRRAEARNLYSQAVDTGQNSLDVNPRDPDTHLVLADCLAKLERRSEALAHLRAAGNVDRHPHDLFFVAVVHAQLRDTDEALAYLERAVSGGLPVAELRSWIDLDSLRNQPRFQALLQRQSPRS